MKDHERWGEKKRLDVEPMTKKKTKKEKENKSLHEGQALSMLWKWFSTCTESKIPGQQSMEWCTFAVRHGRKKKKKGRTKSYEWLRTDPNNNQKNDALKTEVTWQKAICVRVRKDWRWTTLTTEWSPTDGRRIKGRQRRRRIDGLVAFAGPTWLRLAQERDAEWHNGEAFVLLWLTWGCDEDGGEDSEDDDDYINIKKEHT